MNPQEIFNTVAKHLFAQGERAMTTGEKSETEYCAYRGQNGLKCAVGVLIPDSVYDPRMDAFNGEGTGIMEILDRFRNKFPSWFHENAALLESLQDVHDCCDNWETTNRMKYRLNELAEDAGLDASVLKELSFKGK